ncbi:hypothetical protein TNCV_3254841 [Trichonephila clavipes]|nr:hypothetical protein TNCV_3254841 [Trichonephila clavipes]
MLDRDRRTLRTKGNEHCRLLKDGVPEQRLELIDFGLDFSYSESFHAEIVEVVSPSIIASGNFAELNRTVTCRVLKANDRHIPSPMPR